MKTNALVLLTLPFLPLAVQAHEACCDAPAATTPLTATTTPAAPPEAKGAPLKGVILDILTSRGALLVKHEEIPGVMKAMTMLLKVDATTLAAAKKGQAITALLIKKSDGWWLEDVQVQLPTS